MTTRKQFDPDLHQKNDQRARHAVLTYLMESGLYVIENDDIYGPDLVIISNSGYRPKPIQYIEVEIKSGWSSGPTFPWPTIQLPARKHKFTLLGLPCSFWVLSQDLKYAVTIADILLQDSRLAEVSNKFVASGEMFYQIPVEECQIINLEE